MRQVIRWLRNQKKNEKFNYNASVNALKAEGPAGLYLIWGPEDYLADRFFEEIKKLCITSEADDFSYRRLDERDFSLLSLKEAIDSVPFLSERSLVEVRGVDINKLRESDEISAVLSDIPDYCTVVFMAPIGFEPDKRLKVYKAIQKIRQGDMRNGAGRRYTHKMDHPPICGRGKGH